MDSRMDFQRLLEDMDRVIQSKRQELSELDERLEVARKELSEREARELTSTDEPTTKGKDKTNRTLFTSIEEENNEQITQLFEEKLRHFGEELTELDSMNQELAKENELLRRELLKSQAYCDDLSNRKRKLELNIQEAQSTNLSLSLRLSKAEGELEMQEKLLKKSHQEDEVLMDALNDKLDTLKRAIERRDEEIQRLRLDNQFVLEAFGIGALNEEEDNNFGNNYGKTSFSVKATSNEQDNNSNSNLIDSESKQRVLELVSAFREKDSQIELLKGQLLQATRDLERNASLLENFTNQQLNKTNNQQPQLNNNNNKFVSLTAEQQQQLNLASTNGGGGGENHVLSLVVVANNKSRMLESELELKDKQLHSLEFRLHHYETILPNMISDLVRELLLALKTGGGYYYYFKNASTNFRLDNSGGNLPITNESTAERLNSDRVELVIDTLQRLLNGINLAQGLMDQVDQFRSMVEARESEIRQLVGDLNQMDAKFSLVQQQCDLLQASNAAGQPVVKWSSSASQYDDDEFAKNQPTTELKVMQEKPPLPRVRFTTSNQRRVELDLPRDGIEMSESDECQVLDKASGSLNEQSIKVSDPSTLQETICCGGDEQLEMATTANSEGITFSQQLSAISGDDHQFHPEKSLDQSLTETSLLLSNKEKDKGDREGRSIKRLATSTTITSGDLLSQMASDGDLVGSQEDENNNNNNRKRLPINLKPSDHQQKQQLGLSTTGLLNLQSRLRQLESENELLELAMKEILMALRWTDGQCSSLLIDCPSLERLCQLIEARFLATTTTTKPTSLSQKTLADPSAVQNENENQFDQPTDSNLFQLVLLKSELDLLRGQNDQLRVDVKSQRREYHQLLTQTFDQTSKPEANNLNNLSEASCQTEFVSEEDKVEEQQVALKARECENCSKLTRLTSHLSQCILRIETRVGLSDETYMNRLVSLHQLARLLERDLAARDSLLNGSRRECHLLVQQKLLLEARLQFVENQLNQTYLSTSTANHQNGHTRHNMQVYAARNGNGDSIQSLTIQSQQGSSPRQEQPGLMRNARMTISLLRSIINCLQARLDFKDERLQQLESLIIQAN